LEGLGPVIDLAPVNLDVAAVPGAGNLVGNPLCAIAGLLDGPGQPAGRPCPLPNLLLIGPGL
jgi:hypothetical protein